MHGMQDARWGDKSSAHPLDGHTGFFLTVHAVHETAACQDPRTACLADIPMNQILTVLDQPASFMYEDVVVLPR